VLVADYYLRRQAWVAAIARARYCIENYDGAPAIRDALDIMITAYGQLGMSELAKRSQEVYALNYPGERPERHAKRDWWPFW
jgi:outer membrane protein assembly factor BamD